MAGISQNRMITVITAGLNFKTAYEQILDRITILDAKLKSSPDPATLLAEWDIFFINATHPFKTAVPDSVILMTEHAHFRKNYRYNELHAEYMRRNRTKLTNLPDSLPTSKPDPLSTQYTDEDEAELRRQFEEAVRAHVTHTGLDGQTFPHPVEPIEEEDK